MIVFLVSLAVSVVVLTAFEDLGLAVVMGVFVSVLIGVFVSLDVVKQYIGRLWAGFVLALVSVMINNYLYFSQDVVPPATEVVVTDRVDEDTYEVYVPVNGSTRRYESRNDYQVGERLFSMSYLQYGPESSDLGFSSPFLASDDWTEWFAYEFRYPKWLMSKGFQGVMREENVTRLGYSDSWFLAGQRGFDQLVKQVFGDRQTSALVAGMVIGDRSELTREEYEGFIASGLVHIIAVSGGNIVLVVAMLSVLLWRLPVYIRLGVVAICVIGYGLFVGLDSSVLRAVMMGVLSLVAIMVGRPTYIWRTLGLVFGVMIVRNPYILAYDVGLWLSFSALIGLIWMDGVYTRWITRHRAKKPYKTAVKKPFLKVFGSLNDYVMRVLLLPTMGATIGVTPVLIFFMGEINLITPLANILVLPLVSLVMLGGLAVTMLGGLVEARVGQGQSMVILDMAVWLLDMLVDRIFIVSSVFEGYGIYLVADSMFLKYLLMALALMALPSVVRNHAKNSE